MMPTTHDGREVDTNSEDWRLECEARTLLRLPSRDAVLAELAAIERKRGDTKALRERMNSMKGQR